MQCTYLSTLIQFLLTVQKKHWLLKQIPLKCPKGQPVASMSVPTSKAVARSWVHSDNKTQHMVYPSIIVYLSHALSKKIRASFETLAKHVWSVKMEAEGDYSWRLVQLWLHGISAGCVGSIGRFWPARKHEEGSSTLKYHLPSLPKPKDAKPTKNTKNINNRSSNYSAWRAWANEIYWLLSNWIQEHFHAFSEDFCVCRGGCHLMLSNAVISTSPPPTPPLGTAAAPGWGPRLLESKQLGRNFICCSSLTSWASCAWAVLLAKFIEWWCNTDYNQAFQETLHMFLPKKTVYVSMFGASSTSTSQFSFLFFHGMAKQHILTVDGRNLSNQLTG